VQKLLGISDRVSAQRTTLKGGVQPAVRPHRASGRFPCRVLGSPCPKDQAHSRAAVVGTRDRPILAYRQLGENLTTEGTEVNNALIGERWQIDEARRAVVGRQRQSTSQAGIEPYYLTNRGLFRSWTSIRADSPFPARP
jgi:hypothetical protein